MWDVGGARGSARGTQQVQTQQQSPPPNNWQARTPRTNWRRDERNNPQRYPDRSTGSHTEPRELPPPRQRSARHAVKSELHAEVLDFGWRCSPPFEQVALARLSARAVELAWARCALLTRLAVPLHARAQVPFAFRGGIPFCALSHSRQRALLLRASRTSGPARKLHACCSQHQPHPGLTPTASRYHEQKANHPAFEVPGHIVAEPFGSQVVGLSLPGGDVDIKVKLVRPSGHRAARARSLLDF
jgi:hypothetical protein